MNEGRSTTGGLFCPDAGRDCAYFSGKKGTVPSSQDYLSFILEQLSSLPCIPYRREPKSIDNGAKSYYKISELKEREGKMDNSEMARMMDRLNGYLADVENCYLRIAKANGMSYNGLMLLIMMDRSEYLTQKDVCDALYLSKSTVHSIILDLAKRGLLTLGNGRNNKEKKISATEEGKALIEKASKETSRIENSTLGSIAPGRLEEFTAIAEELSVNMVKETEEHYGK